MARTKDFDENEVLTKAIQLFWHKGYNATSMQDLVNGLGISRSSLYDTYIDKHTLFLKALESYQCSGKAKIDEILQKSISAKETVVKLMKLATNELIGDKEQKGCFIINAGVEVAPHDQDVSKLVCQNEQQMEAAFFKVIKKDQQNGEIKNVEDAAVLAKFIFHVVKGMQVTAKSSLDTTGFEDIIRLTVAILD
ncbi:TetR/AcrR family transcriptional regulator [Pedobacter sp. Leaf176]|uniref:TetR/AcrR family transcriptional regulator n=1 Tax=Pedobacter sp. Leaf176 TaxID=1736286 RepID=UPI0006FF40B4|nr:TetR/AcrR family transcriptional regulator [Pedobacter sp. Leaf176]KQR70183.1 TetR family transcriptional regulator [Pedobacter sp. Leaf176]